MQAQRMAWGGLLLVSACMGEAHEPALGVEAHAGALIGGFEANSPKLNAVGSISRLDLPETDADAGVSSGDAGLKLNMACTGALLDERTVITAKHCIEQFNVAGQTGEQLVFALGPDAEHPTRYSTVIDVQGAPSTTAGMQGLTRQGHDVAVLHLAQPLTGAPTVKLGTLDPMQIGQGFAAVGFGQLDNHSDGNKRRLGALTLRALEGRTYELLLGSFEAFFEERRGLAVPAQCVNPTPEAANTDICRVVADDRQVYESTTLEQAGDMLLRGDDTGSQPCFGDSGGPLLRANEAGDLVAYGVVSGGVSSDQLDCDRGVIYARFVPEVTTFLEQSIGWQDPCQGLPEAGECVDQRARRCSSLSEGKRRVVEMDCTTLGLRCVSSRRQSATCE